MNKEDFIFDTDIPNNIIDIYKTPDIRAKKLKSEDENEFRIELQGMSVDYSVVNAVRRTIMTSIPVYAFHRSNVVIDTVRSRHMYNNDLIYNLIETLPIFDIPNYFDVEDPKTFLPTEVMMNLYGKFIQNEHQYKKNAQDLR